MAVSIDHRLCPGLFNLRARDVSGGDPRSSLDKECSMQKHILGSVVESLPDHLTELQFYFTSLLHAVSLFSINLNLMVSVGCRLSVIL